MALAVHGVDRMAVRRNLSALALLFATACTGAASSDLFDPVTDQEAPTDPPPASADPGSTSTGSSGSTSSSSSSSSSSGGSTSSSGGTSKDAGTPPPAPSCASESEPNDSIQAADTFKSCIAGGLKGREVDFVSTVAPATTKQVSIVHTESGGKVAYKVYVNGVPYPSFTDEPPASLPATPNATYTFQIQPTGQSTGDRTWKLEVSFQ